MTAAEQIKAAIRCDEYAARYIKVTRGRARCCFHNERTASLVLHPDYFKCFGCGASGDVIAFAASYHNIPRARAFAMLCQEAGVDRERQAPSAREKFLRAREREEAEEWFRQVRAALVASRNAGWDNGDSIQWYDSDKALAFVDSLRGERMLAAYREQRTPQQAAMLRDSSTPSIIREVAKWIR